MHAYIHEEYLYNALKNSHYVLQSNSNTLFSAAIIPDQRTPRFLVSSCYRAINGIGYQWMHEMLGVKWDLVHLNILSWLLVIF